MNEQQERAAMAPPANDDGGAGGLAVRFTGDFPPPVRAAELALLEAHVSDLLALLVCAANDDDSTLGRVSGQHGGTAHEPGGPNSEGAGP